MSDTNIGSNFPKAHGTKPALEGKERAKSETPALTPESKQQQTDINLNRDPAVVAGRSQVKKTPGKPYVYNPSNTTVDTENFMYLNGAFGALAEQIAQQHGVDIEEAKLYLYEQIAQELSA